MKPYSPWTTLIVLAILAGVFLLFRYYPFKKKKVVDKYPSATVRRLDDRVEDLDETERGISD